MTLKEQIILHEGLRLKPYRCTAGKLTIGIGRNIEDVGISEEEALHMLDNDLWICFNDLITIFPGFLKTSEGRRRALIDLRFNLGPTRFRTFKRMIAAIKAEDWDKAAEHLKDSRWWTQVQATRKNTLYNQFKTGEV